MDIKQTSSHLKLLGQPFDVIIIKNGVEKSLYSNLEPTDVEGLLTEVIATHQPDSLIIQERKRNGSTNVKQDKYPVTLGAIDTPQNTMTMQPTVNNIPADFKDYMIGDLKEKNGKLEKRVDKLETENEQLKKENFELEKDSKFKDKEFEIAQKEKEVERSNGLAGIVETVSTNPALATLAATAIGRLMGVDLPAMNALEGGEQEAAAPVGNAGSTHEKVAGFIRTWLLKQEEDVVTKFFQLTSHIAKAPELLDQLLTVIPEENEEA